MTDTTIKVDMLARVEGEGAFKVVVRDGRITATEFRIFEPPRFFEAFLRGRAASARSPTRCLRCRRWRWRWGWR